MYEPLPLEEARVVHPVGGPSPPDTHTSVYEPLPLEEACVVHPVGEPSPPDAHVLQQTEVHDLVLHPLVIERDRRFLLVRLDAAHVVWLL